MPFGPVEGCWLVKAPWLTAVILGCAASGAAGGEVASLIEKVAQAYGGRAALEQLVAVRETGKVEAALRMSSSGPVSRVWARPMKLRVELGDRELRLLDGAKGWNNGQAVTGPQYQAMVLQAVRLDLPWQLLAHKDKVVEKEGQDLSGKHLRVLELPLEDGLSVSAGVEPETGRILFSSGKAAGGPMGGMNFETRYDDFRQVDGLWFAFKEVNLVRGTRTAETVLSRVELLKAPPPGAFTPGPGKPAPPPGEKQA